MPLRRLANIYKIAILSGMQWDSDGRIMCPTKQVVHQIQGRVFCCALWPQSPFVADVRLFGEYSIELSLGHATLCPEMQCAACFEGQIEYARPCHIAFCRIKLDRARR